MKQKIRRLLNIITVVALSVMVLASNFLIVTAQTQKIDEVNVTVSIPKVGETDNTVKFTASDTRYTVSLRSESTWVEADMVTPVTEFIKGDEYAATFEVTAAAGYELSADTIVKVNGSQESVDLLGGNNLPANIFDFKISPEFFGTVYQIVLNNVPNGEVGEAASKYTYNGENYSAVGIWQKYDYKTQQYTDMQDGIKFENGQVYRLALSIKPNIGYVLDPNASLEINGEFYNMDTGNSSGTADISVSYAKMIDVIDIAEEEIPKAVVGEEFKESDAKIIKNTEAYTVSGYWCYIDDYGTEMKNGTFEKGKAYNFVLEATAKEGYSFSENFSLIVGEEYHWVETSNPVAVKSSIRTSFADVIKEIKLLDLEKAEIGATIKKGPFDIKVPSDAKYKAEACWYVFEGGIPKYVENGTFEKGKAYQLSVDISNSEGYEFAENVIVEAYGIRERVYYNAYDYIHYTRDFSFRKVIEKVEISGFKEPKVNDKIVSDGLKTEANANYEIANAVWNSLGNALGTNETFEKGKLYHLQVSLLAKDGYEFSENVEVFLNGEKIQADAFGSELYFTKEISFKEKIAKIEVSGLPEMKIGNKAITNVKTPNDAKYEVLANWLVWNDKRQCFEEFDGIFENGNVYSFRLHIQPKEEFCFSEDETQFLIDGKISKDADIYPPFALYTKEYRTNQKVIEKIELKVEKFVVGNHASIEPQIEIVSGEGFTVRDDINYLGWLVGDIENHRSFNGYFSKDNDYGAQFNILADEGNVFSEDLVVIVNGVTLPKDAVSDGIKQKDICYFFNMKNVVTADNAEKSDTATKETLSPVTEDMAYISIVLILAVLSMICVIGSYHFLKKKSEN